MQRHELISALGELRLRGMAAAFDEAVVHGIRQRRTVEEILAELLRAEAAERQSRSIRYRLGIAGLPEMKDLDSFRFDLSPVNEALVRSLHAGAFLAQRRNAVLVGGTGAGGADGGEWAMAEAIRGAGRHGRLYWCVKTDLSPDGEIHVMADRIEVAPCGALIAWGSDRAREGGAPAEPSVNLVCAPGRWSAAYAASPVDGGGVAVQSWAGEPAHGRDRAAGAEQAHGLREVPHEPRPG